MRSLVLTILLVCLVGCSGKPHPIVGIWKVQDFQGVGGGGTTPAWVAMFSTPSFLLRPNGSAAIGLDLGQLGKQTSETSYELKGHDLVIKAGTSTPEFRFTVAADWKSMTVVKTAPGDPTVLYAKEGRVEGKATEKDLFAPM